MARYRIGFDGSVKHKTEGHKKRDLSRVFQKHCFVMLKA
ncbi:hypothetical protein D104_09320 [Marinomonas profundimaris]|uniref:Uncharacterized protein n=1 Tax=Marinomonas profundimaris TaxID=1208321 RepID=W1RTT8_9GAMM|nr:hypothetical protein D104_09320 [Marinomonas profundimaris]